MADGKKRKRDESDIDALLDDFATSMTMEEQRSLVLYGAPPHQAKKKRRSELLPSASPEEKKAVKEQRIAEMRAARAQNTVTYAGPFNMPITLDKQSYSPEEVAALIRDREEKLHEGYLKLLKELHDLRGMQSCKKVS